MADRQRFPVPKDAIGFLKKKKIVQSEHWNDLKWGEHSHAFTVAHTMGASIIDDLFQEMLKAVEEGTTFNDFKKNIIPIMEQKGWYGRADEEDRGKARDEGRKTGAKGTYTGWRLGVIFRTNTMSAYSAGRTRQMLRTAVLRSIWVYSAVMDNRTRPEHKALHAKAFPYDDPFWEIYDPPNGWGCRCAKYSITEDQAEKRGIDIQRSGPGDALPDLGIDWERAAPPEWRYSPGREAFAPDFSKYTYLKSYRMSDGKTALRHVKELYRENLERIAMTEGEWRIWSERVLSEEYEPQGIQTLAGVMPEKVTSSIEAKTGESIDPKLMVKDDRLQHAMREQKKEAQRLSALDIADMQGGCINPDAVFREKARPERFHFVYRYDDANVVKVVFRQFLKVTSLQLRTYGIVKTENEYNSGELERLY